jgi:hypothetical protein
VSLMGVSPLRFRRPSGGAPLSLRGGEADQAIPGPLCTFIEIAASLRSSQ